MNRTIFWMSALFLLFAFRQAGERPTLYIIGDSTVKNGSGKGVDGLWGWGDFMYNFFDSAKIEIENHAIGGRSSRTFRTEGRWTRIMDALKPGDYVLIQFGHNDGGPLNTGRARASLKGSGEESKEVVMESTREKETVYTYGWYLKMYVADAKSKGAVPIVLSPVPRNIWKEGKTARVSDDYGKWAKEAAEAGGAFFIDLNEMAAQKYDALGQKHVSDNFFLTDHTHTNEAGAVINAATVMEGINSLKKCSLKKYANKQGKRIKG